MKRDVAAAIVLVIAAVCVAAAGARAQPAEAGDAGDAGGAAPHDSSHDEGPRGLWGRDLLLGHTNHPGLDTFHVLGFSRDGRFAYLVHGCGDEAGYSCATAVVVDLVEDRQLDTAYWSDEGRWDAERGRSEAVDLDGTQFVKDVRALLAKHGISDDAVARGKLVMGDRFEAEQRFRVVVRERDTRSDGDSFDRTSVVSLVRSGHPKRIATFREAGFLDTGGPKPLAVVLSPYERRAAVLLIDWQYGGCIGGRARVLVAGADLDARYP